MPGAGMSYRALMSEYGAGFRTVKAALESAWPVRDRSRTGCIRMGVMRQTDRPIGSPGMPADTKGARRLMFTTAGLLALGGAGFIQQGLAGSDQRYTVPFSDTSF
jgi:hypothetical protein